MTDTPSPDEMRDYVARMIGILCKAYKLPTDKCKIAMTENRRFVAYCRFDASAYSARFRFNYENMKREFINGNYAMPCLSHIVKSGQFFDYDAWSDTIAHEFAHYLTYIKDAKNNWHRYDVAVEQGKATGVIIQLDYDWHGHVNSDYQRYYRQCLYLLGLYHVWAK